jgi:hypothetical protein
MVTASPAAAFRRKSSRILWRPNSSRASSASPAAVECRDCSNRIEASSSSRPHCSSAKREPHSRTDGETDPAIHRVYHPLVAPLERLRLAPPTVCRSSRVSKTVRQQPSRLVPAQQSEQAERAKRNPLWARRSLLGFVKVSGVPLVALYARSCFFPVLYRSWRVVRSRCSLVALTCFFTIPVRDFLLFFPCSLQWLLGEMRGGMPCSFRNCCRR